MVEFFESGLGGEVVVVRHSDLSGISARIRSCLANVVSTRASFWAPDLVVAMMEVGQKNPY